MLEKKNTSATKKVETVEDIKNFSDVSDDFSTLSADEQYKYLRKCSALKRINLFSKLSSQNKKDVLQARKENWNKKNINKVDFNNDNVFEVRNLNLWYESGNKQALFDINLDIKKNKVTALIGPSGCGKSTFLRNLNKMHDLSNKIVVDGDIWFNGMNINSKKLSQMELRTKVGMVFQKPSPFNMSIYDNVAFGPKNHGIRNKERLDEIVKTALEDAALWDEVKNELHAPASSLSGGQQQRLCIARSIALEPDVLLMDEPTSALDPIATGKIEKLIKKLSGKVTIVIVTHSMTQAQRISDNTVFFLKGKIIESNTTKNIFTKPKSKELKHYLNGDA